MPSPTQEQHHPNHTFTKEVKRLYSGPVTLILFISGILYLALLAMSFLVEADYIFLPLGSIFEGLLDHDSILPFLLASFTILVTVMNFIGMTLVRFHAASENLSTGCITGCYFIKISKLLQHVVLFIVTVLVAIRVIVGLNDAYRFTLNWKATMEYWFYIGLTILVAAAIIFFHLMSTISVSVIKEALVSKVPITGTHILSAIGYFLLGGSVLVLQFFTSFNLTLVIAACYCVLWGVYKLRFRNTMETIAEFE